MEAGVVERACTKGEAGISGSAGSCSEAASSYSWGSIGMLGERSVAAVENRRFDGVKEGGREEVVVVAPVEGEVNGF